MSTTMVEEATAQPETNTESSDTSIEQQQEPTSSNDAASALPDNEKLHQIQTQLDALETMRRANLEVEFSSNQYGIKCDHDRCTFCQRDEIKAAAEAKLSVVSGIVNENPNGIGARFRELKIDGHRIRSLDGRRIRSFSRRFLSKSATVGVGDAVEMNGDATDSVEKKADSGHEQKSEDLNDVMSKQDMNGDVVDDNMLQKVDSENKQTSDESNGTPSHDNIQPKDDSGDKQPCNGHADKSTQLHKLHLAESCPARLDDKGQAESITNSDSTQNKSTRRNLIRRAPSSCLACGHPTCSKHISSNFSTRHIPICQQCAYLFELDFLVDVISTAQQQAPKQQENQTNEDPDLIDNNPINKNNMQQCQQQVNTMIDCYDRAKLLLTYTAQYAPQISTQLQSRTDKSNKIGVTANASGIVSGITGIVGAGALLCPPVAAAGVPILIASLVFGGGATAVHTGDYAAVKYWSEPNMLADKMVVLHSMCLSLLRVVEVLNFMLSRNEVSDETAVENGDNVEGQNNSDESQQDDSLHKQRQALTNDIRTILDKHGVNHSIGKKAIASSTAISGSNVANRQTRFFGRVGTAAAASVRFVPIVGGVISAATLVVEANEIKATLARMNEGSPCEKSQQILEIAGEVERLPDASLIAGECTRVFQEAEQSRLALANGSCE